MLADVETAFAGKNGSSDLLQCAASPENSACKSFLPLADFFTDKRRSPSLLGEELLRHRVRVFGPLAVSIPLGLVLSLQRDDNMEGHLIAPGAGPRSLRMLRVHHQRHAVGPLCLNGTWRRSRSDGCSG